jgi:lysophospholipase L1-like esterase
MRARWFVAIAALLASVVVPGWITRSSTAAPIPAAVIGDSLTAGNIGTIRQDFVDVGLGATAFDALSGRNITQSITYSWGFVPSGVSAATAMRESGVQPSLWIVQLGANNVSTIARCSCDQLALARSMIATMRAAIGAKAIAWVNVRATTSVAAVEVFNQALRDEAADDATFHVIDWFGYSAGKDWFADHVHPNVAGAAALGACMAASASWLTSAVAPRAAAITAPPATVATEAPIGAAASASATATRLGRVGGSTLPPCDELV